MTDKPMTFGSLFAGIGGIDLGLERAGWECKWQVEIDPYCQKVLAKHWPDVARWDDVCTFPPAGSWDVDLIAGGFPCQDISFAGQGAGLKGERSGLFYEVVRIAERLRPRFVLLENVTALLVRGLGEVLRALAEIGFHAEWHSVPAAALGAPHRRDRVFILAYPDHRLDRQEKTICTGGDTTVSSCEDVAHSESERVQGLRAARQQILPPYVIPSLSLRESSGSGEQFWKIEPSVGRVVDGLSAGVDRAKRIKGLGNAVVPQVAEFFGALLAEVLWSETDDD